MEFNKKSIKLIVPGPMKTETSYGYEKKIIQYRIWEMFEQ